MESKTGQLIKVESRMVVARGSWGWEKWGDVDQRVRTFSYVGQITSGELMYKW